MNREIKFRAWDTFSETMIYSSEENAVFILDESEWRVKFVREKNMVVGEVEVDAPVWQESDEIELMQFTGMKDSFGEEIYEGDIVKCIANEDWPDENTVSDIVFSDNYQWQVRTTIEGMDRDEVGHGMPIVWGGWKSIEVLGNIYENPKLLSNEQNVKASVATEDESSNEAD